MQLSSKNLADAPRWSSERTASLSGQCRGDLLGPWGENLLRRFGNDAVDRVRARLPAELSAVSAAPTASEWLPVEAQLRITEAIIDEFLGGDANALYPLIVEDSRRGAGRASLVLLRALGPKRMFKLAPRTHRKVYDVGMVNVRSDRDGAHVLFIDAPLFAHPTWRLLQLFATRVVLELQGRDSEITGQDTGPESFAIAVRWHR